MNKVIVIAGPTASGKTALSIKLAKKINAEIVSCDSMQIYKTLDIGTAKPTMEEQDGVKHHMLDVCFPDVRYSVADYVSEASASIDEIFKKGKIPVVVGGTGLYIDNLLYDNDFSKGDVDEELRRKLMQRAISEGGESLKKELETYDKESALRLHDNDLKRIVRAMEFYITTGTTISEHNRLNAFTKKRYDFDYYVLCPKDRQFLYDRINTRVDFMMENGLLDEARNVCCADWFLDSTASQAIGYKEFFDYFNSDKPLSECVELLKQHSRNYAKRQLTWFKNKKVCDFIDISDEEFSEEELIKMIERKY